MQKVVAPVVNMLVLMDMEIVRKSTREKDRSAMSINHPVVQIYKRVLVMLERNIHGRLVTNR